MQLMFEKSHFSATQAHHDTWHAGVFTKADTAPKGLRQRIEGDDPDEVALSLGYYAVSTSGCENRLQDCRSPCKLLKPSELRIEIFKYLNLRDTAGNHSSTSIYIYASSVLLLGAYLYPSLKGQAVGAVKLYGR